MFRADREKIPYHSLLSSFIANEVLDEYKGKHHKDFPLESAISYILFTLLDRKKNDLDGMLLSHSPNLYSKLPVTYHSIHKAIEILINKKIIKQVHKGSIELELNNGQNPYCPYKWIPIRDGLTSKYILNHFSEWDVYSSFTDRYNLYLKVTNQYEEDNAEVREKDADDISVTIDTFNDPAIDKINKHLVNRGFPELQYKRIFHKYKNGDLVHGRFYNAFQRIPKEERKTIYKEKGWVELDMHAMAPNILYMAETGAMYPGDVYSAVTKYMNLPEDIYRPLIKKCMMSVLGTPSREEALKSIRFILIENGMYIGKNKTDIDMNCLSTLNMKETKRIVDKEKLTGYKNIFTQRWLKEPKDNNKSYNQSEHFFINPEYLLQSIEKVHIKISKYFYSSIHNITTTIESELLLKTLKHMIKLNILPLSIHDCIIIPKNYYNYFISFLYNSILQLFSSLYNNSRLFPYINNISYYINISNPIFSQMEIRESIYFYIIMKGDLVGWRGGG